MRNRARPVIHRIQELRPVVDCSWPWRGARVYYASAPPARVRCVSWDTMIVQRKMREALVAVWSLLAMALHHASPACSSVTPSGGGFMTNTSPLAAPPFGNCPWCPDDGANALTGTCSCPAGHELVQPLATISDCALSTRPPIEDPPLRPSTIGLCLPFGFSQSTAAFGGAWQQDIAASGASGRCRSPNLITGDCSCPRGFDPVRMTAAAPTTMPADGATPMAPSVVVLCAPGTHNPGFGGVYQSLDPALVVKQNCSTPNPLTGSCSCPVPTANWTSAAQSFRVVTYAPHAAGAMVGSAIVVCTELPPPVDASALPSPVEICDGVHVDPTGTIDAARGIQQCIKAAYESPTPTLGLPAGTYLLHHRLDITQEFVLQTMGVTAEQPGCGMVGGPRCAVLRAAPELTDDYGLLLANGVTRLRLDHIVLDGNRGQRLHTGPGISCGAKWTGHQGEGRQPAYNSGIHDCSNCSFRGFASINALCGTGCEYSGANATFEQCLFQNNGNHFGRQSGAEGHKWSDGLTMGSGPGALVRDCLFQDNSDINFIIADSHGARIERNTIRMVSNGAFGGIMMDNFNSPSNDNHSGTVVQHNIIDGGSRLHYGIELGPRPWYTAGGNLRGPAIVTGNVISGAGFLINVDGAGLPGAPFIVSGNKLLGECVKEFACVSGAVE
jgi:hypothetical protein